MIKITQFINQGRCNTFLSAKRTRIHRRAIGSIKLLKGRMKMNKIALITGGSRGLGRAGAEHAAARGVDVIVTYRSGKQEAEDVVRRVEQGGGKAAALA